MTRPTWLDPADVPAHVGGVDDVPEVDLYLAAAARYVERLRPDLDYASGPATEAGVTGTVPDDVRLAALMLTARLYARRGTALGVQSLGDAGVAYIARTDPDVARLLGIGVHTLPAIG